MTALDLIDEWPVSNAAAGWIRADGTREIKGDGARPFLLASVTKPLVAITILVAVEEGSLILEDPAGPEGSTIRHLLSHGSGLGPNGEVLAKPAQRRIYSNNGFDLLGQALEVATGMTMASYFHEALVLPLGLTATSLHGSPAHAGTSSVDDLLKVVSELMAPTLIAPATHQAMTTPVFDDLAGVLPGFGRQEPNSWGLGFEIRGQKSPHWTGDNNSEATFGHFGQAGTFLWVDPTIGAGCVALTDEPFGPWSAQVWPPFCDAVVAEATAE